MEGQGQLQHRGVCDLGDGGAGGDQVPLLNQHLPDHAPLRGLDGEVSDVFIPVLPGLLHAPLGLFHTPLGLLHVPLGLLHTPAGLLLAQLGLLHVQPGLLHALPGLLDGRLGAVRVQTVEQRPLLHLVAHLKGGLQHLAAGEGPDLVGVDGGHGACSGDPADQVPALYGIGEILARRRPLALGSPVGKPVHPRPQSSCL